MKSKFSSKSDGRRIVADLLVEMDALNSRRGPNVHGSRKRLLIALRQFPQLCAGEQKRFASALNEYIASEMQGAPLDADTLKRTTARSLEGTYARLATLESNALAAH